MRKQIEFEMPLLVEVSIEGDDEDEIQAKLANTIAALAATHNEDELDCDSITYWWGDTVIHSEEAPDS